MICDGSSTKSHATLTPGEATQLHAAQAVVQQMAELVKNGLDLAMREQGRRDRRRAASGCRRSSPGAA